MFVDVNDNADEEARFFPVRFANVIVFYVVKHACKILAIRLVSFLQNSVIKNTFLEKRKRNREILTKITFHQFSFRILSLK